MAHSLPGKVAVAAENIVGTLEILELGVASIAACDAGCIEGADSSACARWVDCCSTCDWVSPSALRIG